jgi:hypothetical protein
MATRISLIAACWVAMATLLHAGAVAPTPAEMVQARQWAAAELEGKPVSPLQFQINQALP